MIQQRLDRFRVARSRRYHQGRLSVPARGVCIRARLQKQIHKVRIPVGARQRQRRFAILIGDRDLGPGL